MSESHRPQMNLWNGQCRHFKKSFKKLTEGTVQDRLSHFIFSYHTTPQTSTGISPAERLMGRSLHSRLHLLTPNLPQKIEQKQE